ncbi:Per1-like-domain-containing protein [Tuber brumale]|nr:Per1-like-domain-containing protein [Tuber brumale]
MWLLPRTHFPSSSSSSSSGSLCRALAIFSFLLFAVALFASPTAASRGDRLPEFKDCVQGCKERNCLSEKTPLPLHLRLLLWNCPSECDYACQRSVTASRAANGQSIEQFHGKWPFKRFWGVQEPFSALFSILNGYVHYAGLKSLKRELPRSYPLDLYYRLFSIFGIFCWFWSTVFHMRDFVFTERMDYFAAGANVLYGLYLAPIRIFRLYRPAYARALRIWGLVCIASYTAHVYFLLGVRWDYTYNMLANVVVGSITNTLWTYWSIRHYTRLKSFWAAWPGLIVMWLIMAMSLELLDFPPLAGALDAHSLWHAATILPGMWWYKYVATLTLPPSLFYSLPFALLLSPLDYLLGCHVHIRPC